MTLENRLNSDNDNSESINLKEDNTTNNEYGTNKLAQIKSNYILYKNIEYKKCKDIHPFKVHCCTINNIFFYQTEDHPLNKRGFKYKLCRPNKYFKSSIFSTTDSFPYKVRLSYFDRSQAILLNEDTTTATCIQGWRSARTNIGIREGKYYFEFNILKANETDDNAHVRIGIGRREASLEAPVGFDGYSYGFRDINGDFLTMSKKQHAFIEDGFKSGDVIGFLLELPSLDEHKKFLYKFVNSKSNQKNNNLSLCDSEKIGENNDVKNINKRKKVFSNEFEQKNFNNIIRDQVPIKYKKNFYFEQYEFTKVKLMDPLLNSIDVYGEKAFLEKKKKNDSLCIYPKIPNSRLRIFKNGVEQKSSIENLFSFLPIDTENKKCNLFFNLRQEKNQGYKNTDDNSLGYYPMVSVFQKGIVKINTGPCFKYNVEDSDVKSLSDRYDDYVVEEWFWDLMEEVECQFLNDSDNQN